MTVRWLLVSALVCACGHPGVPSSTFVRPPHLPPPPPSDPTAFGHAYLETIGARIEADWSAFLEDVRLRLPPTDPLNDGRLVVQIDCQVARDGSIDGLHVASSGREAFDRAAIEVLRDAAPFAPPPAEVVSDDDTVHLRWTFARDRRQAGVAGARIDRVEWPLERAVPKLLAAGDVGEAARRLAHAAATDPHAPALIRVADWVFHDAIVEAVRSTDGSVRREAAAAIEATHDVAFAHVAEELAKNAVDPDVRLHAIGALGARRVTEAGEQDDAADGLPILLDLLAHGPELPPPIVAAAARVIVETSNGALVDRAVLGWLAPRGARAPSPDAITVALAVCANVAVLGAEPAMRRLLRARDPMTRGAACTALAPLAGGHDPDAWAGILRGLDDPDATVRATCAQAAQVGGAGAPRAVTARLAVLVRDRDERVRGAAAIAAATLDPARAATLLRGWPAEKSVAVRVALATAWGRLPGETPPALIALAGDPEPAVRASAVAALANREVQYARAFAANMVLDPDPQVRLAAIPAITTPDALADLLTDDDPQVRSAALDRDARLRGRAAALLARATALAAAPPASVDRVRIARSWLLAK